MQYLKYGSDGRRDTPVSIPNTEVKPPSGDGTNLEANWESSTEPNKSRKGLFKDPERL